MESDEIVREFDERGFVVLEDAFSAAEVAAVRAEVRRLEGEDISQRLRETDSDLIRAIYGVHELSPVLGDLTRDPRLVTLSERLLRSPVYIHQTQVSPKKAFGGNTWPWHQDFLYWNRDDGMPTSNALSAGIYLDDVTELNGPMFVIDGSHRLELQTQTSTDGAGWEKTARAGDKYTVAHEVLAELMDKHGITSVKGRAGSLVMFHSGLLHCSPPNLSGRPRSILFVRYNAMDNALREVPDPRPAWLANRNPEVIRPLAGGFLASPVG
jgi:ectoine hydroxylase